MSRIGKLPIKILKEVTVTNDQGNIVVKGPKGELKLVVKPVIEVEITEEQVILKRKLDDSQSRAYHGLYRSLISNMVTGVTSGFTKGLEMSGVGYKAKVQGEKLILSVGYSHSVEYLIHKGVIITVTEENKIAVSGIDKEQVGLVSAQIRKIKPCEPYKGKGIKYVGEFIRRKAGKSAKTAA